MPAKRKTAKKSLKASTKTKSRVEKEETKTPEKKKASFRVVETKSAGDEVKEKVVKIQKPEPVIEDTISTEEVKTENTGEVKPPEGSVNDEIPSANDDKPLTDLEDSQEITLPKEKTEEAKSETTNKIPSITSFSQLDSQSSTPVNSNPPPNKKVEKVEKDEKKKSSGTENEKKEGNLSSEDVKEWLKDVRPDTSKEVERKSKSGLKVVIIIVVVLAVLGIIAGGVFYYQAGFNKKDKTLPNEPEQNQNQELKISPTITETPEPTLEEIDLSELSVNILNGSGITGEAGRVNELLTKLNFKEIETGNADSYDYTTTFVNLKQSIPNTVFDKISEALGDDYTVEKDSVLEDSSEYDIEIIVGSQETEQTLVE